MQTMPMKTIEVERIIAWSASKPSLEGQ